ISASVTVSPPAVGTITRDFLFFNEADVVFAGQPVAGETWTLTLGGTPHSVVSHDGDSLASIVQQLAALIPTPEYQVSVGLSSLFVVHGFGLFGGFFGISISGSVTLNPTQVYGGANVQKATPVGIDVTLNGSPVAGETWTLDLDGKSFATSVASGDTLSSVASHLAALVPTTPAAAQGGAYYTVGVSDAKITIRRIDQAAPIVASVSV